MSFSKEILSKLMESLKNISPTEKTEQLLQTSILISQEKVNEAIWNALPVESSVKDLSLTFRKGRAQIKALVQRRLHVQVTFEVEPQGVRTEDEQLVLEFRRVTPLQLEAPFRWSRWLVKAADRLIIRTLKLDLLQMAAREVKYLEVDGERIRIRMALEKVLEYAGLPRSFLPLKKMIALESLQFEENGIRLGLQILPQFFG